MIEEGRQFDYVFGDLTDIPISTTAHGDAWDFIRLILNSSLKVLKPTGKFMTHVSENSKKSLLHLIHIGSLCLNNSFIFQGNGASCPESLKMYEDVLMQLSRPVTYTRTSAFVPSFFEDWIFYQVSLK